jgi:transcriptional regulator with XRE-family HTH domain
MVVSVPTETTSIPTHSSVGARVKWLMEQRGWSLSKAADESGVSHSTLSLLVRGIVDFPKIRTIELLARAFKVPRSFLMPYVLPGGPAGDLVAEGVLLVPVVRLFATATGAGHLETGELIPVPLSINGQHQGIMATLVTGGGLPPYVAVGALAIFDPDRDPLHRDPVVIDYQGSTHVAWYLEVPETGGVESRYRLGDGTYLDARLARLAGVLLGTYSSPPRFGGA